MGDFRLVVEAAGGHGCNRTAKAGDEARGCGSETCPDCITARYIAALKQAGIHPNVALYTHWPAQMRFHEFVRRGEEYTCVRCAQTFGEKQIQAAVAAGDFDCPNGVKYDHAREVVDDLTERKVKYPHVLRVTPVRVKGSF